jgi:hypothetical protein
MWVMQCFIGLQTCFKLHLILLHTVICSIARLTIARSSLMFADLSSRVVDPIGLTVSTSSCLPRHHGRKSNSKASSSASLSAGRENGAGNLSATLDKLWFWEKKLYQEIKVHNRPHTSNKLINQN